MRANGALSAHGEAEQAERRDDGDRADGDEEVIGVLHGWLLVPRFGGFRFRVEGLPSCWLALMLTTTAGPAIRSNHGSSCGRSAKRRPLRCVVVTSTAGFEGAASRWPQKVQALLGAALDLAGEHELDIVLLRIAAGTTLIDPSASSTASLTPGSPLH